MLQKLRLTYGSWNKTNIRGLKMPGFMSGLLEKKGKTEGKKHPKKKESEIKRVSIFRYDADECDPPYMQQYEVDTKELYGGTVLDIINYVKWEIDPTLSYRRSCREGICGSCAMNINGKNALSCIMAIPRGKITILPLPHLYVIKDLVCDMSNFYRQYNDIQPWLQRCDEKDFERGTRQLKQSIRDSRKLVGMYECILCACCSTSCPSYWWHGNQEDRFLGPAALLNCYRWVIDSRDEAHVERLERLKSKWNLYRCHTIFNCTNACPKKLNPGKQIAKLKLMSACHLSKEEPDIEQDNELIDPEEASKSHEEDEDETTEKKKK